jgi:hypothetical protein
VVLLPGLDELWFRPGSGNAESKLLVGAV